jgi:glycosyltransferase involved in cell wall biosynthesis
MERTGFALIGLPIVAILLYRLRATRKFCIRAKKIRPLVSVIILTKNNQKLFEHVGKKLLSMQNDIHEIILLDMGSIDSTVEVAQNLLGKNTDKVKILNISTKTITENYLDIVQSHFTGEIVVLFNLAKIGEANPNVYVPDIFKPLTSALKALPRVDARIDGSKLLLFDHLEREKNSIIYNEYILEPLSNIGLRIETFARQVLTRPEEGEEKVKDILQYFNKSMIDISELLKLISSRNFSEQSFDENMLGLFKDYTNSHGVAVNYKIAGQPKRLKEPIKNLILGISQDLLYTTIHHNLTSSIDVWVSYKPGKFQLFFKVDHSGEHTDKIAHDLSHFMHVSIQNRLNLVGGRLRVYGKEKKVRVMVTLPLNMFACQHEMGVQI